MALGSVAQEIPADPAKREIYGRARPRGHADSQILAIDFTGFTGTKKGGSSIPLPASRVSTARQWG
jgi:hypothetical protein